jgi:acyl-CoA thioesterase
MGTFADDIVVTGDDGLYVAELDESWNLAPLPQGGVITSLSLRAAMRELAESSQELRSCTTVFAGQVASGALEIEVHLLRRGRSASQVSVAIRNVGAEAGATTLAVFGTARRGPSFVDVAPPVVRPPTECRSYREPPPAGFEGRPPVPFWTRMEGRAALGHPPWETWDPGRSDVATWLRFDDDPRRDDGALDPLGVITLADRMPGCIGERIGPGGDPWFAPSADLTVHLFAPARSEWLLAHDRARWAHDGWASAESALWDESGNLIAYATQMMIFTYLQS